LRHRQAAGAVGGGGDGGLGLERARDMQEVEILDGLRGERGKLIALSGAGGL
jgi:hypothetical protein